MRRSAIVNWSYLGFILSLLAASELSSARDKGKSKQPEPYALLSGTCFDGRGFRLAGASVQVELSSEPSVKLKKKRWETTSSPRGEFAIRLPAGRHTFRVSAAKEGFKPIEKTVSFDADERQDIALNLDAEPTKK
jgi:hypothetical protein